MPDEETILYCICRSSDGKRFMICCDRCDEWFHGDCIHIKEKEAKFVEKYFCQKCIEEDPTLAIVYKPRPKPSSAGPSRKKSTKKKRAASRTPSLSSKGSSEGHGGKHRGDESGAGRHSSSDSDSVDEWNGQGDPRRSLHIDVESRPKAKKPAKPKRKSEGKQRRPSGSSVGEKKTSKKAPVSSAPTGTASRPAAEAETPAVGHRSNEAPVWDSAAGMPPPLPVPPEEAQRNAPEHSKPDVKKLPKIGKKGSHYLRRYSPRRSPSFEDDEHPGFDWNNFTQCFGPKCRHAAAPDSKYCSDECGRALNRKRLLEFMPLRLEQMSDQNFAATQVNQKEMDTVRKRLIDVKSNLDTIEERRKALQAAISMGKRVEPVSHEDDDSQHSDDLSASDNMEIYCVTCGLPQSLRTAIKHFEKCFNRYENQTSYGSLVPTPNSIFCDVQNPKTKTWCKRLKVLCPEHFRESAEDTAGVCGFPLTDELFRPNGRFCHSLKRHCSKHPAWERVKRAELDLELLRAYIKMEELAEQEANLMRQIQSRGGIVQSMLNYTTVMKPQVNGDQRETRHDLDEEMDIVSDSFT